MKKLLSILLALTVVLGLCAGCGGNGDNSGDNSGVSAEGKVTLTIGVAESATVVSWEENALTKWIEEQCNVELEFLPYPGGTDVATQISTTVAARKELPDILWGISLGNTVASTYGKDGYFVNLSTYLDDKEGASKTFWERMEATFDEEDMSNFIRRMTSAEDGNIYGLPTIEVSPTDQMMYQMWINTEWLDAVGLEKPTNNEELYKVLSAFLKEDCNGNGSTDDEIALFGTQSSGGGAKVVDWLINLFVYYNNGHRWQDYDGDGDLEFVYVQDAYRDALKYVNKLYKEGLLHKMCWTSSQSEAKNIITPNDGVAKVGLFAGHLTIHIQKNSELMYQYEPLQTWGCAVTKDYNFNFDTFITTDCANPDKAFEVLMTLYSEEGSRRLRYGEKGVNWDDADEGAVSAYGLPAAFKLINDPLGTQNAQIWSKIGCTLNYNAEGEDAQTAEEMSQWEKDKNQLHAESRKLFDEAAEKYNPSFIAPVLQTTAEEQEEYEMIRTNIYDLGAKAETEFITGTGGRDINNDAHWAAFVKEMEDMGMYEYEALMNKILERQTS